MTNYCYWFFKNITFKGINAINLKLIKTKSTNCYQYLLLFKAMAIIIAIFSTKNIKKKNK